MLWVLSGARGLASCWPDARQPLERPYIGHQADRANELKISARPASRDSSVSNDVLV